MNCKSEYRSEMAAIDSSDTLEHPDRFSDTNLVQCWLIAVAPMSPTVHSKFQS
jgi:hypothetical protein